MYHVSDYDLVLAPYWKISQVKGMTSQLNLTNGRCQHKENYWEQLKKKLLANYCKLQTNPSEKVCTRSTSKTVLLLTVLDLGWITNESTHFYK